jgi:hypothetical protein
MRRGSGRRDDTTFCALHRAGRGNSKSDISLQTPGDENIRLHIHQSNRMNETLSFILCVERGSHDDAQMYTKFNNNNAGVVGSYSFFSQTATS